MKRPLLWKIIVAAGIAAGAAPPAARAQSATAQAESLFRQGRQLVGEGKLGEGCGAFAASQKLDPAISTLLNEADCREKNGQLATAWSLFLEADRQTRAETTDAMRKMHRTAVEHAGKLEPRLSTLTVRVPDDHHVPGLQILRDGVALDDGAWNRALPIDGGRYQITARAPGNADWSTTVVVGGEHDAKTIETPRLQAVALPVATTTRVVVHPGSPPSRLWPIVFGGAAVALAAGAVGFELSGSSTYDQSKREADDARQHSLWTSANTKRYTAEALGVAGAASAGVAVWLYLRYRGYERHDDGVVIQPIVNANQAGLALQGTY